MRLHNYDQSLMKILGSCFYFSSMTFKYLLALICQLVSSELNRRSEVSQACIDLTSNGALKFVKKANMILFLFRFI